MSGPILICIELSLIVICIAILYIISRYKGFSFRVTKYVRATYPVAIHHIQGTYGISFPDFPGCITLANEAEEILSSAKRVLDFHIKGMLRDGESIPAPTTKTLDQLELEDLEAYYETVTIEIPKYIKTIERYK